MQNYNLQKDDTADKKKINEGRYMKLKRKVREQMRDDYLYYTTRVSDGH